MQRSEFIKQALNSAENTVCVNVEQVEVMLNIFEKLGMLPPQNERDFCYECGEAKDNLYWDKE